MGEPCVFTSCEVTCWLADGQQCKVTDAVKLHVKILAFSWDHEFKVLRGGPFPAILGLDFLNRTKMRVDVASRKFSFGFAPNCSGTFSLQSPNVGNQLFLQNLCEEVSDMAENAGGRIGGESFDTLVTDFPTLFSSSLGTADCVPYDIELSDSVPVRSPPYRWAPP